MKKIKYSPRLKDFVDFDYWNKLDVSEKEFLLYFINEYYCGQATTKNSLHLKKLGENAKKMLNKEHNARNSDLFSYLKTGNSLLPIKEETVKNMPIPEQSDPMIQIESMITECFDEMTALPNPKETLRQFAFDLIKFSLREIKRQRLEKKKQQNSKKAKAP